MAEGETAEAAPGDVLGQKLMHSLEEPSTQDLSLMTKLVLGAIIVAVCYAFVKAYSPRRTGPAGRHGAYEKGGLP